MGPFDIFNDRSIILTFLFNMKNHLTDMEGNIIIITEKTSITARKMSIIAPGIQHPIRNV